MNHRETSAIRLTASALTMGPYELTSALEFFEKQTGFQYHNEVRSRRLSIDNYRLNKICTKQIKSECMVRQTIVLHYGYIRYEDTFTKSNTVGTS